MKRDARRHTPGVFWLWFGLLLFPWLAWARAGGGQHFSGGGSSGGGSGGGGGVLDLLEIVYWALRLTFEFPAIAIPLWIVVIGFIYWKTRDAVPRVQTSMEVRQLDRQRLRPRPESSGALDDLRRRDPSLDLDAFFERVRKMFLDIQEAWVRQNLDPVRCYMSDGLYRRFTTLLALMQLENQRNGLADIRVRSARLLEVTSTSAFDCLTVRIQASMRDVDVPATFTEQQARERALKASATDFAEVWTFIRRRGAISKAPGTDASQGKCPNCGAPFTGGAANKCGFCGAIVNSGNYDWVLSEITQESEYVPHDRSAPGFEALAAKDQDAAEEVLCDRASLLFWKYLEAAATGDPAKLRKLATAEGLDGLAPDIERLRPRDGKPVLRIPAVGGTMVAEVLTDASGLDQVSVDIRWSAAIGPGDARPFRSVLTMVRAGDAKTDRGTGLSNERCGNCGAPLTDSDSPKCDYCGHDLSAASREWQFQSIVPIERWQRHSVVSIAARRADRVRADTAFATASERQRLMRVMVAIVKADGIIELSERRLLRDCAAKWRIEWKLVQQMLEQDESSLLDDLVPEPGDQARAFMEQLVAAAKVDGRVDRRERDLLYRAAEKLGLETSAVDTLLAA